MQTNLNTLLDILKLCKNYIIFYEMKTEKYLYIHKLLLMLFLIKFLLLLLKLAHEYMFLKYLVLFHNLYNNYIKKNLKILKLE